MNSLGVCLTAGGSILNNTGGLISGGVYGILFRNVGGTVTNYGTIQGTYEDGFFIRSVGINADRDTTILNGKGGVIEGKGNGIWFVKGGTIENYGEIRGVTSAGSGAAIVNYTEMTVTNNKGALIIGGYVGISGGDDTTIDNNGGVIEGGVQGICFEGYGTVTNSGKIIVTEDRGDEDCSGIWFSEGGTVTNSGEIISSGYYGVFAIGDTEIVNSGTIQGIYGIYFDSEGSVTNSGKIAGSYGILNGGVIDITNNHANAIIEGSKCGIYSYGGSNTTINNISGTVTGVQCSIYSVKGSNTTVNNSGIIQSEGCGIWLKESTGSVTNSAGGLVDKDIYIDEGAKFMNYGLVRGDVVLANAFNDVTFAAGSKIDGDFYIGNTNSVLSFIGNLDSSLRYSIVTGDAYIGSAMISVSFDIDGLPSSYTGGRIVLIDAGSGSIVGTPDNNSFSDGGFAFSILVENDQLVAVLSYGISLNKTEHEFSEAKEGYGPLTPLSVTVRNIGNMFTGDLSITMSGLDASSFTLSSSALAGIAVGGSGIFTITPATGLSPGVYTATISVGPSAGNSNPIGQVTMTVSFTVGSASVVLDSISLAGPSGTSYTVGDTLDLSGLEVTAHYSNGSSAIVTGYTVSPGGGDILGTAGTVTVTVSYTEDGITKTAEFSVTVTETATPEPGNGSGKVYYITATSDSGSVITPEGKITVPKNGSKKFRFSAEDGYVISAVYVDGAALSKEQIALGCYTFADVMWNHTISVTSEESAATLTIDIVDGTGYAEYSVNGGPFMKYAGPVLLPGHADITVKAYADDGYKFKMWSYGSDVSTEDQISFSDVTGSLHLQLHFTSGVLGAEHANEFPWWIVATVLLILGCLLALFLLFCRRYYEVYIQTGSFIKGEQRVHRKSPYTFTMSDRYTGAVSYRVGEKGAWKQVFRNADGTYVIPRGETVGTIYLERHP